ncbi:hypothetical protein [Bradyrhizobium sp.]
MPFDADLLDADVGRTPQRDAPALARVSREIAERPPWMADQPLVIDAATWKQAREEMVDVQKSRGFPLARATDLKTDNFLLRGVPVVIRSEA